MLDPVWEERYLSGAEQRYPWSQVVSFVMRNRPRDKAKEDTRILEVGCGTSGNLWFAAREGFQVTGFDGSAAAIAAARKRFIENGLTADFSVALFTELDLPESTFDLAIDRGALTCAPLSVIRDTIAEIGTSLVTGGRFLFTPYASEHSSRASAGKEQDRLADNMTVGPAANYGALSFLTEDDIRSLFEDGWHLREMLLNAQHDLLNNVAHYHAEWQIVAEKC